MLNINFIQLIFSRIHLNDCTVNTFYLIFLLHLIKVYNVRVTSVLIKEKF